MEVSEDPYESALAAYEQEIAASSNPVKAWDNAFTVAGIKGQDWDSSTVTANDVAMELGYPSME